MLDTAFSSSLSCVVVTTNGFEGSLFPQNATFSQGLALIEESASAIVVKQADFPGCTGAL